MVKEIKNKTFIILAMLLVPNLAHAKIILCEKKCAELKEQHINPIKGLIYELAHNLKDTPTKKIFLPHAAKTIVWMNKIYKDKKTYNLKDYKNDDRAKLILTCVSHIIKVVNGEEDVPIEETMIRWGKTGERVVAEYEEVEINTNVPGKKKTGPKTVIKYKLELSKK